MIAAADRLLRADVGAIPPLRDRVLLGVGGAAAIGVALGASSGHAALAIYAAVKVPMLLVLTTSLCLPSFFVVNTVLGLRGDFGRACEALVTAQAVLGCVLGTLTPFAVWTTLNVFDPYALTLFDALLFALAAWGGQQMLRRLYAPLIARDERHRHAVRGWLVLYAFAGVQVAWVLRPFRGTEGFAPAFLRAEAFEQNAYVVLCEHLVQMLR